MGTRQPTSFGDVLRRYRIAAALTQGELAERAGLSLRGVSDLERGARQRPQPGTVRRLAEALDLSDDDRTLLVAARHRRDGALRDGALEHELPQALTSFVGRQRELAEVCRLLETTRLLTLTGAGGVGKTRLALEVARAVAASDGARRVCFVQLAFITDSALVERAVAAAVGANEHSSQPLVEVIVSTLRRQRMLLIFDNCEHLLDACAQLAERVLRACAGVHILSTSRQRLNVAGETVWRVPSLTVPSEAQSLEDLVECDAVRLFVDRATELSAGFALSEQNTHAMALLCRRLDGIPLAIELAAARVNVLSVEQITVRLADSLDLLAGGSRTAPDRQQTLEATFKWSYDLLDEAERTLLLCLPVFAGGWTLEAAEAVCTGARIERAAVLALLARLVDKSLVLAELGTDGLIRYRLLEPLRRFLVERAAPEHDAVTVRQRHACWYAEVAQRAAALYHGPREAAALVQLEQEYANLRVALRHLYEQGNAHKFERLSDALWWFWFQRNQLEEARAWFDRLVALPEAHPPGAPRTMLLYQLGAIAWRQGDYAAAQMRLDQSLALADQRGDPRARAYALMVAGPLAIARGEYGPAVGLFEEGLALARQIGDRWCEARTLGGLSIVALQRGDFAAAASLLDDAIRLARPMGDNWSLATLLNELGDVARARGDYARAGELYRESTALHQRLGAEPAAASLRHNLGYVALHQTDLRQAAALFGESLRLYRDSVEQRGMAECLVGMAGVAASSGDRRQAARLLGAAEATFEALGAQLSPSNRADFSQIVSLARAGWSPAQFGDAWAAGHDLPLEDAVEEALAAASDLSSPGAASPRPPA